ncbi:hypothetical protein Q9189_006997 [Teloschistes chrysophthalmus]
MADTPTDIITPKGALHDASGDRQQVGHAKGDTSRDCNLAQQIEPVATGQRSGALERRPRSCTYQPVTQEANADTFGGARMAAQKYGPPLVGIADTISAIPKATNIAGHLFSISPLCSLMIRRTEETDDDPSNRHHTWPSGVQAIREESALRSMEVRR